MHGIRTRLKNMKTYLRMPAISLVLLFGVCGRAAAQALVVDDMVVVLIDAVDVPASETGVIASIDVREGNSVKAGQRLASLDDRQAKLQESLAKTELQIAEEKAENGLATDAANKKLAEQKQMAKQLEIAGEIASRKAGNGVRVLASKKSEAVAKNELERATRARQEYADSVSRSEIDGLRLSYEKTRLETQQAEFERQIDELNSQSAAEAAAGHAFSIDRSEIEVDQAIADQRVHRLQAQLKADQSKLAVLTTLQHRVLSPIDGVVVQRFHHSGEWVTAGEPVVRVIRLNRLRAEGFVTADKIAHLRENRTVVLSIDVGDAIVERAGQIVFISPEIDPVNREVRFWVEFENPKLDVLPGMRLSLRSES